MGLEICQNSLHARARFREWVDDRAFFNVALQPKFEDAVLSIVCGDQAREVKLAVYDFDQTDTGVPSVREVLVKVLDES